MTILNDQQRRAVTESDGPALVLAGAGTGKTRVIVERLAWLIGERGVDPRNILALTFTNRAAEEMRSRIAARLCVPRVGCWVGTFHAFGLHMLRREGARIGLGRELTVYDDGDQLALMKKLVADLPAGFDRVSPRNALHFISGYKQKLEQPKSDDSPSRGDSFEQLWRRYHAALAAAHAVDFDDLLVLPVRMLEEHEDVRTRYQQRYQYIHVDEYQDTNHAQYVFARLLSGGRGNLFVVGDEDQSIYSWRGADIQNILDFEADFPHAKVFRLEENYRSDAPILKAANAVVAHNTARLGKTLWTKRDQGEPVRYYLAEDEQDEARFVADEIGAGGLEPGRTAILYRTNAQSRVFEEALRRRNLAFVVIGSVQFYQRKEIKDLLAYLRLLVNPADDVSVRRILNVPPRGLGAATLDQVEAYAAARSAPLFGVLRDAETDQSYSGRARTAISGFIHTMDDLAQMARGGAKVAAVLEAVIDQVKYRDYLQQADAREAAARLENVAEFLSACAEFDKGAGGSVAEFLQELALMSDADGYDPATPVVSLLTCHAAKGLEFDQVYLVGLEEGLLPHATALDPDCDLEEERRLCYVAMTRARKRLTLSSARSRLLYGTRKDFSPSRFLEEIPEGAVAAIGPAEAAVERAATPRPADSTPEMATVKMGTVVRHAKFGKGTVMYTSGSGSKLRARIRFDTGRTREFMVGAAPLEIIKGGKR